MKTSFVTTIEMEQSDIETSRYNVSRKKERENLLSGLFVPLASAHASNQATSLPLRFRQTQRWAIIFTLTGGKRQSIHPFEDSLLTNLDSSERCKRCGRWGA
jgi:hypothetical protein